MRAVRSTVRVIARVLAYPRSWLSLRALNLRVSPNPRRSRRRLSSQHRQRNPWLGLGRLLESLRGLCRARQQAHRPRQSQRHQLRHHHPPIPCSRQNPLLDHRATRAPILQMEAPRRLPTLKKRGATLRERPNKRPRARLIPRAPTLPLPNLQQAKVQSRRQAMPFKALQSPPAKPWSKRVPQLELPQRRRGSVCRRCSVTAEN